MGEDQTPEQQQQAAQQQQEQQRQQQIAEQLASLEASKTQSEIEKNNAAAVKSTKEAEQTMIENALIAQGQGDANLVFDPRTGGISVAAGS